VGDMVERRKQDRFKIDTGVYVFCPLPNDIFMGNVVDISRSGIAFSYFADNPVPDDINKLGLLASRSGSTLEDLPFQIISDEVMPRHPESMLVMKRSSGRFLSLTPVQQSELERFIETYLIG
jgi:hypothetical protein